MTVTDDELVRAWEDEPDQITGRGKRHGHPVDSRRVAMARERLPSAAEGDRLTSVLSLIADPTRTRLLYALDVVDELCVGDLAIALSVSEDAVSYGLRLLRTAGLVTRRKEGRIVYYRLAEGFPEPLRQHCLRQLIEMSRAPADDDG
ncbi:metalloregulator ArsR/SmtB family transcription factor [Nocardioides perillae]|uniref:DNA-binding transcriptional ArsR family regulator n=1 Tax=Nocardioides perillae TaxID=1119534 RepID=A0A7Y9RTZ8_9ACTN|nr:DNA-binding transcriptional ArsR family regulator [Nocardioides perillae]